MPTARATHRRRAAGCASARRVCIEATARKTARIMCHRGAACNPANWQANPAVLREVRPSPVNAVQLVRMLRTAEHAPADRHPAGASAVVFRCHHSAEEEFMSEQHASSCNHDHAAEETSTAVPGVTANRRKPQELCLGHAGRRRGRGFRCNHVDPLCVDRAGAGPRSGQDGRAQSLLRRRDGQDGPLGLLQQEAQARGNRSTPAIS